MKRERSGSDGSDDLVTLGSPVASKKKAKKGNRRCNAAKNWDFVWNNYPGSEKGEFEEAKKILIDTFEKHNLKYIFQAEVAETGTPHLQGYVGSDKKIRPIETLLLPTQISWRTCRKLLALQRYASKPDTRTAGPWANIKIPRPLIDPLEGKQLYPWQEQVMDIINTDPDERSIHWFWESEGCKGKTALCKHLAMKHGAIVLSGKANDIKYAIAEHVTASKPLDIVLLHFTRTTEDFVSYDALESVKDGLFFSGKYESKSVIFNPPHVICFANFPPDESKLSKDRWHIYKIE